MPGVLAVLGQRPVLVRRLAQKRDLSLCHSSEGTIGFMLACGWDFPNKTVIVKSFAAEIEAGKAALRGGSRLFS